MMRGMRFHPAVAVLLLLMSCPGQGQEKPRWRPLPWFDVNMKTGVHVGDPFPAIRAQDQSGQWRTLADLTGPGGLMLVIIRSADW